MTKYSEQLLDYFHHLDHAGTLAIRPNVFYAKQGEVEQGDLLEFFVEVNAERITQIRFQCFGAAPSLAACEFVCRRLEGQTLQQASSLSVEEILLELKLDQLHNHVAVRVIGGINQIFREIP